MLKYVAETHEYFWNGSPVCSVNQVLQAEGIMPNFGSFKNAAYKRLLGTYVHKAIKLSFERKLDENSLQGEVKDYFEGFKRFMDDFGLNPFEVEKPLYSKKWGFAGMPDCWDARLFDWKCSKTTYDHYALTMGAYSLLVEEAQGAKPTEAMLVMLSPNSYKIEVIEPDRKTFLAVLLTHKWKKERGV